VFWKKYIDVCAFLNKCVTLFDNLSLVFIYGYGVKLMFGIFYRCELATMTNAAELNSL
jgi:hypothetical protein